MNESIRDRLPPAGDQGERPTCLSFALTTAHYLSVPGHDERTQLSEEMLHQSAKQIDRLSNGITLSAASSVLQGIGQCRSDLCPYLQHETVFNVSDEAIADAFQRRAKLGEQRTNHRVVCDLLQRGEPVVLVLKMCPAFFVTLTGYIPLPPESEVINELHAVLATGVSRLAIGEVVEFRNSWGEEWGQNGYGFLELEYIDRYCVFARTVVSILCITL